MTALPADPPAPSKTTKECIVRIAARIEELVRLVEQAEAQCKVILARLDDKERNP